VIAGAFLLWLVAWGALPPLLDPEIPGDNLEQLRWALDPVWGYAKHPPFPTWILWCFERTFPAGVPLTYALGALQVALMLWLAWLLSRATLKQVPPWLAPLMIACMTYYTYRMRYYNHNTMLMVAYAAALYSLWRAVSGREWRWWLALGVSWGIGMLSKYQMAVPIACNLFFLWRIRSSGAMRLLTGMALASVVAGTIFLPHVLWLITHDFASFGYASITVGANLGFGSRVQTIVNFALHQAARVAPLLLLLVLLQLSMRSKGPSRDASGGPAATDEMAREFWRTHAWGPLVLMLMLAVLFGVALENHWGMASLWALPLWLLTTSHGRRWASLPTRNLLNAAAIVQIVMIGAYATGI
jgi:4-amino-4-deoxy-L-arabinose transferase-like glycosyltransferase